MKFRRTCDCGKKFHSVDALKVHVSNDCPAQQPTEIPVITPEDILRSAREMQAHYDLPISQRVCGVCDEVQSPSAMEKVSKFAALAG